MTDDRQHVLEILGVDASSTLVPSAAGMAFPLIVGKDAHASLDEYSRALQAAGEALDDSSFGLIA
jgi:hypothetical protein